MSTSLPQSQKSNQPDFLGGFLKKSPKPSRRNSSDSSNHSNFSAVSRKQIAQQAFKDTQKTLNVMGDQSVVVQRTIAAIQSKISQQSDDNMRNQDAVIPTNTEDDISMSINQYDQIKENILEERKNQKTAITKVIKMMNKPQGILTSRHATMRHDRTDRQATMESQRFRGSNLAQVLAKQLLIQSALKQRKQLEAEAHAVESFKKDIGYDLLAEKFVCNVPIKFKLYPDRKTTTRTSKNVASRQQLLHEQPSKQFQDQTSQKSANQKEINMPKPIDLKESDQASLKMEKTMMYAVLAKEFTQRTENDVKEIRNILMSLDFIKKSEQNFHPSDLTELAKSVSLEKIPVGKRAIHQDDDANSLVFVVKGRLMATFKLAEQDKMNTFLGKKDTTADGLVKSMKTIQIMKKEISRHVSQSRQQKRSNSSSNYSPRSGFSANSKVSRARSTRRGESTIKSRKSGSCRRSTFLTSQQSPKGQVNQESIDKIVDPGTARKNAKIRALNQMVGEIIDKKGEKQRQAQRKAANPLDQMLANMGKTLTWTSQEQDYLEKFKSQPSQYRGSSRQRFQEFTIQVDGIESNSRRPSRPSSCRHKSEFASVDNAESEPSKGPQQSKTVLIDAVQRKATLKVGKDDRSKVKFPGSMIDLLQSNQAGYKRPNYGLSHQNSTETDPGQPRITSQSSIMKNATKQSDSPQVQDNSKEVGIGKRIGQAFFLGVNTKKPQAQGQCGKSLFKGGKQSKSKPQIGITSLLGAEVESEFRSQMRANDSLNLSSQKGSLFKVTTEKKQPFALQTQVSLDNFGTNAIKVSSMGDNGFQTKSSCLDKLDDFVHQSIESHSLSDSRDKTVSDDDSDFSDCHLSAMSDVSRDGKGNPIELELCKLERGQYSGVHALILAENQSHIQQRRSCSLHAVVDTYILIVPKDKYKKAVETCKNRVKNEKMDYLKSVELVSIFQRNSLKMLTKFLVKKHYNKSQTLYREGEMADRLYFVLNGEFKVSKKIVVVNKKQEDHEIVHEAVHNQASSGRPKTSAFPLAKQREKKTTRKKGVLDLIIVTERGVLGDEDAVVDAEGHTYMTTCECISKTANVYELKAEDFLREGKKQSNWSEILELIHAKRDKFASRVIQKNEVQNDFGKSLKRKRNQQVTNMAETVNQWTDVGVNSFQVRKEKDFKRLISAKMQQFKKISSTKRKEVNRSQDVEYANRQSLDLPMAALADGRPSIPKAAYKPNHPYQSNIKVPFASTQTNSFKQLEIQTPIAYQTETNTSLVIGAQSSTSVPNLKLAILQTPLKSTFKNNLKSNLHSYNTTTRSHSKIQLISKPSQSLKQLTQLLPWLPQSADCKPTEQIARQSLDVSHITRFLPTDLKYGSMKHHTLSAHLRAKETQRQMFRSGTLQGHQLKQIDPKIVMQEKKQLQQKVLKPIKGVLPDHDHTMKQIRTLRQQSRKLQLDYKTKGIQNQMSQLAQNQSQASMVASGRKSLQLPSTVHSTQASISPQRQNQMQNTSNYLKRSSMSSQKKMNQQPVVTSAVSDLAQKLCHNMQGQTTMFGGSLKTKNTVHKNAPFMSGGQLRTVSTKLLPGSQARNQEMDNSYTSGNPAQNQARVSYYAV